MKSSLNGVHFFLFSFIRISSGTSKKLFNVSDLSLVLPLLPYVQLFLKLILATPPTLPLKQV